MKIDLIKYVGWKNVMAGLITLFAFLGFAGFIALIALLFVKIPVPL